jgi:hypothetical protein
MDLRPSSLTTRNTMADVIVIESNIHGHGVFATRDFRPGEVILLIDDSRIVEVDHSLRPELGEKDHHCEYLEGGLFTG